MTETPNELKYNEMPPGPEMDREMTRVFDLPDADYSTNILAALRALGAITNHKHISFAIFSHDGTGAEPAMLFVHILEGNHTIIGEGFGGVDRGENREPWSLETAMPSGICRALLIAATDNRESLKEIPRVAPLIK